MKRFLFLVLLYGLSILMFGQTRTWQRYGYANKEKYISVLDEYKSILKDYKDALDTLEKNQNDTINVKAVVKVSFYFDGHRFQPGDSVLLFGYSYIPNANELYNLKQNTYEYPYFKLEPKFKYYYGFYWGKKKGLTMKSSIGKTFTDKKVFRAINGSIKDVETTKSGIDKRYHVRYARMMLPIYANKCRELKNKIEKDSIASVLRHQMDSIAKLKKNKEDSIRKIEMARRDSINKVLLNNKINEIRSIKTPIIITNLFWKISDINTVHLELGVMANARRLIKYVEVECEFYDRVGGVCYDYLTNRRCMKYKLIGYVARLDEYSISRLNTSYDKSEFSLTPDVYLFNTKVARSLKITAITITFDDNRKIKLTNQELQKSMIRSKNKYDIDYSYINPLLFYKKY